MKNNNAFVTSCWGGYQGFTFDPLASYSATGISIPLTNETINFKVKYTCPSTSTGCYVYISIINILRSFIITLTI